MLTKTRIFVASSLLLLGSSTLSAADFQQGLDAYERGDYKSAYQQWQPLANQGDSRAQKRLGDLYKTGSGVPQNYRKAVDWYSRASKQGNDTAQNALGVLYMNGQHVHQNFSEALRLFQAAATKNNPDAMNNLGIMYTKGLGMDRNATEAERWYEKAAAMGHISAQHNLAFLRNYGTEATQAACSAQESTSGGTPLFSSDATGVTQLSCEVLGSSETPPAGATPVVATNAPLEPTSITVIAPEPMTRPAMTSPVAVPGPVMVPAPMPVMSPPTTTPEPVHTTRHYQQLAMQGDADAQYRLGVAYLKGVGMPQDFIVAYTWLNLAASQGIPAAAQRRDELMQRMTPSQLEQGQGLSRDYYQQYVAPFK